MGILNNYNYQNQIQHNSTELWSDIFEYSKNLNGNWFISQKIFNTVFVPNAVENPRLFAKLINEVVDNSNIKIKQKSKYKKTITLLKRLTFYKNRSKKQISKVLFDLFNTGLNESYLFKINY